MDKVLSNTTPLIALADIDQLDLLHKLYNIVVIPQAVMDEIMSEPARSRVSGCDWIVVEDIGDPSQRNDFTTRLHAGEVDTIILAMEQAADLVIMDDAEAKKAAKDKGLKVIGTMGVLVRAKQEGFLNKIEPVMNRLIQDGLYISDSVRNLVLEMAGELNNQ